MVLCIALVAAIVYRIGLKRDKRRRIVKRPSKLQLSRRRLTPPARKVDSRLHYNASRFPIWAITQHSKRSKWNCRKFISRTWTLGNDFELVTFFREFQRVTNRVLFRWMNLELIRIIRRFRIFILMTSFMLEIRIHMRSSLWWSSAGRCPRNSSRIELTFTIYCESHHQQLRLMRWNGEWEAGDRRQADRTVPGNADQHRRRTSSREMDEIRQDDTWTVHRLPGAVQWDAGAGARQGPQPAALVRAEWSAAEGNGNKSGRYAHNNNTGWKGYSNRARSNRLNPNNKDANI